MDAVEDEWEVRYTPVLRIILELGNPCEVCPASFKAHCCGRRFWRAANAEKSHP